LSAKQLSKKEGDPYPEITLRVYDYAGLQAELLSRALGLTKTIFADAGVVVVPIICTEHKSSETCNEPLAPLKVVLRIVPRPAPGAEYEILGYASGSYIIVNYSGVKEIVDHSQAFLDKILGCVIAHELGHVLLGPDSHSSMGIMTAGLTDWELRPTRTLFVGFLPFQKARIRAYVRSQTRGKAVGSIALAQR
jgi:hypothetical protein